jgi:hypothetical protein
LIDELEVADAVKLVGAAGGEVAPPSDMSVLAGTLRVAPSEKVTVTGAPVGLNPTWVTTDVAGFLKTA